MVRRCEALAPPSAGASLFLMPSLELNQNFIASYSNLHLRALFSFLSRVTGLFWLVTSPDCVTVPEFLTDALQYGTLIVHTGQGFSIS